MIEWIEVLRVAISFLFLVVSSWYDFKTREVPNRVWVFFAPIGLALTSLQFYLDYLKGGTEFPAMWLLSFALTAGISIALFHIGFFGGADAKALICLSIALPVHPSLARYYIEGITPFFPLATLTNAVLGSSLLVLAIISHNLIQLIQGRGRMFEGLEAEPLWSKILAFAIGFKVDLDKLRKGSHYIPLERFSRDGDGRLTRRLRISPRLEEEPSQNRNQWDDLSRQLNGRIWATPGLPFLVFITAGFVAAFLVGDFVTWLVTQLILVRGI